MQWVWVKFLVSFSDVLFQNCNAKSDALVKVVKVFYNNLHENSFININNRKVTVAFMHREPGTVDIILEVQTFCLKLVPKILFSVSLPSWDQMLFAPEVFSKVRFLWDESNHQIYPRLLLLLWKLQSSLNTMDRPGCSQRNMYTNTVPDGGSNFCK